MLLLSNQERVWEGPWEGPNVEPAASGNLNLLSEALDCTAASACTFDSHRHLLCAGPRAGVVAFYSCIAAEQS